MKKLIVTVAGVLACSVILSAQAPTAFQLLDQAIDAITKAKALINQPPEAVNCTVSDWTMQSSTAWGTCSNNQQTRQETWTRTKVTPEANGGSCVPLSETRTGTQACGTQPPGAPAISSVSGSLIDGQNIRLVGSNFGSKTAKQPWKWDDMNGVAGARLEPRGWLVHINTPQPLLSTVQKRTRADGSAIRATSVQLGQTGAGVPLFGFGDNGGQYLDLTPASTPNLRTPPTTILIDYWAYFQNGGAANNYKFWRWHMFSCTDSSCENRYWGMPSGNTATESSEMSYFNAIGVATINGKWVHHRLYLRPDSVQANVFFQHAIDQRVYMDTSSGGRYAPPESGFTAGPWPTMAAGDHLSTFMFEMQNSTDDGGARNSNQYVSDVAIDQGYGAVYLGSAATWAGSSHTEYQPYSSWVNGSITVKVNKGSFSSGPAWLYVVSDGRAVNASGFSVTIQ